MRLVCLFLFLALAPIAALAQGQGDPVTGFADSDEEMNAAMAEAVTTLPALLAQQTDTEGFGQPGTMLKVAFELEGGGAEIIWVAPFWTDGSGNFVARLANEPNFMGNLHVGDRVRFTTDMIRDWSWHDGRQLWGNYTTRVMLPHLSEAEAAQLRQVLSPTPIPAGW